jgi:hypothetical protein
MSLLTPILQSKYSKVVKCINEGANVNDTLNSTPPMTMLEVAIETNKENPSPQSNSIIELLKSKGALTYEELLVTKPINKNLPPLAKKGIVRGNIKITGIAGLPRRGGIRRSRRSNRTRKNRN